MRIEEVGVNLSREQKPHRLEPRFVAYVPGGTVGVPQSHPDALREAIALGDQGCVGFVSECEEPAATPAAPATGKRDYSIPLPAVLSRLPRGGRKSAP